MADSESPISSQSGHSSSAISAGNENLFSTPVTGHALNKLLFLARTSRSLSGISTDFADALTTEETQKKNGHVTEEELRQILEIQRQGMTILEQFLADFNFLSGGDPKKEHELERMLEMWRRHEDLEKSITGIKFEIEKSRQRVNTNTKAIDKILEAGINSPDRAIHDAAIIAKESYDSSRQMVTITYRMGNDVGEQPQHLVYKDEAGKMYIKDLTGNKLYIDTLYKDDPVEKKRMENNLAYQIGRKETFGNDAAAAAQFEKANKDYMDVLRTGGGWIVAVDKTRAEGRDSRVRLKETEEELKELQEEMVKLKKDILFLENKFSRTKDETEALDRLKKGFKNADTRAEFLTAQMKKFNDTNEQTQKITGYLVTNNFNNNNILERLPDSEFKQNALATQKALKDRLEKLEKEEASAKAAEQEAARKITANNDAKAKMTALQHNYSGFDQNMSRRDWSSNLSRDGVKTGYITDDQGNKVYYDKNYGLFYKIEIDKATGKPVIDTTTGKPKEVNYRNPEEIVKFFTESWQGNKFFANEKDIGDITFKKQFEFVRSQLGRDEFAQKALANAASMQMTLITDEKHRINEAMNNLAAGGTGGLTPGVVDNPQKPAAAGIDPITASNYRPAFADAADPSRVGAGVSGTGAKGPGVDKPDLPENEVKKPVISVTSDANRVR